MVEQRLRLIVLEPALSEVVVEVISTHFPNGFKVDSHIELLRFRRFLTEDFGAEISVSDEELRESIVSYGTFFNGKIYVISHEIESRIQNIVDKEIAGGADIIFYNSFYARHEEWLFPKSIISEEMLKDILLKLYPKYRHKANYFSPNTQNDTELVKISSEIIRVWGSEVVLNYEQLSERLPYIPLDKIKYALSRNDDFIRNSTESYTHFSKVDVSDEEYSPITDYVKAACQRDGFASFSDVPLGEIQERNDELTLMAIHNAVFKIVLADQYDRHGKIKKILAIYKKYKGKLDLFHVAYSGGKDSAVLLDLVKKALPKDSFVVVFGDTGMEFPDTYNVIEKTRQACETEGIPFYIAKSHLEPKQSWELFGPPSRVLRWCCSVHKTAPQTLKLREITGKNNYIGLDFVGVRKHESVARGGLMPLNFSLLSI